MKHLVGEASTATTNLKQLEQNRFETAMLYNKRLALITDSDKYGGSVNVLKAVTGQDSLRREQKNVQQNASFVFSGMVLIASNEPIQSTDYTSGLERRRATVKFDTIVGVAEKAKYMKFGGFLSYLLEELPGLVNWALELTDEQVTEAILQPPQAIKEANYEAQQETNSIADWLTRNCKPAPGVQTNIGAKKEIMISEENNGVRIQRKAYEEAETKLYPNYLQFCLESGLQPVSSRRFSALVIDNASLYGVNLRKPTRQRHGYVIVGIQLLHEGEALHAWLAEEAKANEPGEPSPREAAERVNPGSDPSPPLTKDAQNPYAAGKCLRCQHFCTASSYCNKRKTVEEAPIAKICCPDFDSKP